MLQILFVSIIILSRCSKVYGEIFESISLHNGRARLSKQRSLDISPDTLPTTSSPYHNSFAVRASFGASYLEQQGILSDSDFEMQMIISTSHSGLNAPGSCHVFRNKSYICQSPLCTENTSSPQSINYPFFSSTNATSLSLTNSTIFIANGAWQLTASPPLYIYNCNTTSTYFLAGYAYGWIGLGLSAGSNFQSEHPVFSFLMNRSSGESQLIFGFNSSYTGSSQPVVSLNSDADWRLSVSSLSFGPSFVSTFESTTPLIFDVQYHRIALPATQYRDIMRYLHTFEYQGMTCDLTQQDCFFSGNLSVLPNLTFTLTDGSRLSLPPAVYMIQYYNSIYYTMFDSFDTQFAQQNYTVIGTNVMAHYYSVFSNPSSFSNIISLYPLGLSSNNNIKEADEISDGSVNDSSFPTSILVMIIVGAIFVVCFVGLVYYMRYNNKQSKRKETAMGKSSLNVELNQTQPSDT